jgi:hypothetical protein
VPDDLASIALVIIDASLYMVLGTADEDGRPWASPVYYAPAASREFFWVSRPEARHSRNLEVRPQLGIVIFDSSVAIGTGPGVFMSAVAEQLRSGDGGSDVRVGASGRSTLTARRRRRQRSRPLASQIGPLVGLTGRTS